MSDILAKIAAYKREEVEAAKSALPRKEVEARARNRSSVRGFTDALRNKTATGDYALIAEIKRASPSKGLIRPDFRVDALATAYEAGGAACLSVLTDRPSFQGENAFINISKIQCSLPVLRKDFMLDTYQVAEARLLDADCILIIMAMVDDDTAKALEDAASEWKMDVIAEVHDEAELERALMLRTPLIGINNRDLKTFETRLETSEALAPMVPDDRIVISESGLFTPEDLARMSNSGINTFLIGESLMRQDDVEAATRAILKRDTALSAAV